MGTSENRNMKTFGLFAISASALSSKELFDQWKSTFDVKYQSPREEARRFDQWMKNKDFVEHHNMLFMSGKKTHTVGMNKFADLSNEEYGHLYLSQVSDLAGPHPPMCTPSAIAANSSLPASADWRDGGAVVPIKDQGQCGSCWAFSTIAGLEGQWFLAGNELTSLSEQQLVDCSQNWGNFGCGGGLMDQGFTYIHDIGGVETQAAYPYTATDGTCAFDKSKIAGTLSSCEDLSKGDEGALQNAIIQVGPISVGIDASHISSQLYQSGVYYEPNCSSDFLDHGVTAIGYGTDNSSGTAADYWLVKNSWGTTWGNQGYIQMARNKQNNCGIATQASYPII